MSELPTKGPWIHDKSFPTSIWAGDVWVGSANVESVANFSEREANARLMAAAPELLEALKVANDETKLYEGHPGRWAELIAKAGGK